MMISFQNDGPVLVATNYWETEHARKGFCFLSWNAGAGRLLVPDATTPYIREMRTAQYVIVSRGAWKHQGGRQALELLFEDNSDRPFCVHLMADMTDRLLPTSNEGGGFEIMVLTRAGEQLRLPGKYRKVRSIPSMKPW